MIALALVLAVVSFILCFTLLVMLWKQRAEAEKKYRELERKISNAKYHQMTNGTRIPLLELNSKVNEHRRELMSIIENKKELERVQKLYEENQRHQENIKFIKEFDE